MINKVAKSRSAGQRPILDDSKVEALGAYKFWNCLHVDKGAEKVMKISNHPPLIPYHKSLLLPKTAPRSSPTINVKIAEPIIAHTMGNRLPPTVTAKISGRPNLAASHIPIYAPMNPTTIETRQPPRS